MSGVGLPVCERVVREVGLDRGARASGADAKYKLGGHFMKMHSDNPSSNTIGAGISEESLKQAVKESGYPLQAVAADQLKRTFEASKIHSYLIKEEWPYIDDDTG